MWGGGHHDLEHVILPLKSPSTIDNTERTRAFVYMMVDNVKL
jgi:hypothetical protein